MIKRKRKYKMSENYDEWKRRKREHYQQYHIEGNRRTEARSIACNQCFSMRNYPPGEDFENFWRIIQRTKIPAEIYNRNTL